KPSSSSRPWGKSRRIRMGGGTAGTARAPTSVAQRGHRREARSPDGDGNEAIDRSLDTEVRHRRVALGEEEIERVLVADFHAELGGHRIHLDRSLEREVHAAEVDAQM